MAQFTVTIDNTKVSADLTDFPVYIDLSDMPASFWSTVTSSGGDIRCYKSDGTTELPREVVWIDTGTNTGELHVKYTGTLSGSSDTEIIVEVDGTSTEPDVGSTYGSQNVRTQYEGVWHLDGSPASTITDATGNGYDMSSFGSMTTGNQVAVGPFQGYNFNGSTQYLGTNATHSTYSGVGTEDLWLSFWIDDFATSSGYKNPFGFDANFAILTTDGELDIQSNGDNSIAGTGAAQIDDNSPHYCVAHFDQGTIYNMYVDGSLGKYKATTDTEAANDYLYIARQDTASREVPASFAEVRWSKNNLGSDWQSTEYANQNSAATFYTITEDRQAEQAQRMFFF